MAEVYPGNSKKYVYQYSENRDKDRMGNCVFLPKDGDYCVCIEPSGDCFDNYFVIRKQTNGKHKIVGYFGAYSFGEEIMKLSDRNFHLFLAGEEVDLRR